MFYKDVSEDEWVMKLISTGILGVIFTTLGTQDLYPLPGLMLGKAFMEV